MVLDFFGSARTFKRAIWVLKITFREITISGFWICNALKWYIFLNFEYTTTLASLVKIKSKHKSPPFKENPTIVLDSLNSNYDSNFTGSG